MPAINRTMLQYFHWDYPADGSLWRMVQDEAAAPARAGITALWLPPPTKAFEPGNPGYAIYDLWDLANSTRRARCAPNTAPGPSWKQRLPAAHAAGLQIYIDVVFNHKGGTDDWERTGGTIDALP